MATVTSGSPGLGRVRRSDLPYVDVHQFGAVGDGVADDAAAVQAAVDSVETFGGVLVFPPGKYLFGSQVTINRTYAASGSNFVGERNLVVSGYGAEIHTTGAISAFDVLGGWAPNRNCTIEGFNIYHRDSSDAVAGIRMVGAGMVTCREISVSVSSSLPAGYAAFSLENATASDANTGCFWCVIEQCVVRPWAGADGYATYGVKAMGGANALTLRNNTFGGASTHVILMAHPGQTYTPNSVNIDGNFFEGPASSVGIDLVGANTGGSYHVSGCRITNNRFESLDTAVSLTGTGTTVPLPTYMSGNYADTTVADYVVNSGSVPIVMLDAVVVGSPMGPAMFRNQAGIVFQNDNASYDAVTAKVANQNSGIKLQMAAGTNIGSWRYKAFAGGNGTLIGGTYASTYNPFGIIGCSGIAVRDTPANNLAGASSFSAATTKTVSFPVAETNANYLIFLEARADQKLWVSAKGTADFTVTSDVSSSNAFGWLLIRHL